MYDIVALGECLIDFAPMGKNDQGMPMFAQNPGGAPANVLAMYKKLGGSAAFIGKVGQDDFGDFLADTLRSAGIDCTGLLRDDEIPTTLAFVQLDAAGDRSFTFYRKPGADIRLTEDELPDTLLAGCRTFHFGSVSLTDEPCRSATLSAATRAKAAGATISYDPNYRPFLWPDEAKAKAEMLAALPLANLVKVSEEEMVLLTSETDLAKGAAILAAQGASLVVITRGALGCYYHTASCCGAVPTFAIDAVDTTGSGDAFWGNLLYELAEIPLAALAALPQETLHAIMARSNTAGTLTATKKGAIPAMPSKSEIEAICP